MKSNKKSLISTTSGVYYGVQCNLATEVRRLFKVS